MILCNKTNFTVSFSCLQYNLIQRGIRGNYRRKVCQNESLNDTVHLEMRPHTCLFCFCTRTRFETEAQGNSEMACCPKLFHIHAELYCNTNEKS